MLLTLANIAFFLIAVAMIVLILLQRGAGAAAGSGFGAGASATVFGARGSANFLSRSTAVLATLFFLLSLGMAVYASRVSHVGSPADDLGVMGALQTPTEVPAAPADAQPAPATEVPAMPAADPVAPAADSSVEQAPAAAAPAADAPVEQGGEKPAEPASGG